MDQTNIEYYQKKEILDVIFEAKLITFFEWYRSLIALRESYDLAIIK